MNDCFYEEWPERGSDNDVNPTCSLGLIRMVMRGALDISSMLDVDDERRSGWQDILDKLSDYPVGYTEDGSTEELQGNFVEFPTRKNEEILITRASVFHNN